MRATFLSVIVMTGILPAQQPKPVEARDAVSAVVEAFKTHDVVALGEGDHGNDQGHAFRVALLNGPRSAGLFNEIRVLGGEPPIDWAAISRAEDFRPWLAQHVTLPMEQQFDAILYLGPTLTFSPMPLDICGDATYMKQRRARVALTGMPPFEAERFTNHCAGVLPR